MIGTLDTLTFPQYKFTTIENFTDHLFDKFNEALKKLDCQLLSLEISESPTRTCVITAL